MAEASTLLDIAVGCHGGRAVATRGSLVSDPCLSGALCGKWMERAADVTEGFSLERPKSSYLRPASSERPAECRA